METAARMYPAVDPDFTLRWLSGVVTGRAPIGQITLLRDRRVIDEDHFVRIRARVQYCREDGSGTRETKQFDFAGEQRWVIDAEKAPSDVDTVTCF